MTGQNTSAPRVRGARDRPGAGTGYFFFAFFGAGLPAFFGAALLPFFGAGAFVAGFLEAGRTAFPAHTPRSPTCLDRG